MHDDDRHAACVNAWLARTPKSLSAAQRLELMERAFAALWRRASATLGEITVWAIANRVVRTGQDRFPAIRSLELRPDGLSFQALCAEPEAARASECFPALAFLLRELLTVLGSLTGEILTPELHNELSKVAPASRPESGGGASRARSKNGRTREPGNGE